ncbi:tetratricopeptide repeat protein [Balneolaceae bacterium YR4-1]|uniref:Tetratricopeptide repeat protein n=1 Tax=Halalkalibaculum roseum TaxID=2709311 RepID=A0A6M1T441_9BACT|nr:tetratricopeptide repeat protein [Halalkalibaculum roseum]NGP77517.1 tetratricopeptide repeat protein [Halalkalibaculum roseum]
MNRTFITLFALLGLAFLAVTILKFGPKEELAGGVTTDTVTQTNSEEAKSKVLDFWNYYNNATDFRTRSQYPEAIKYYRLALEIDSTHKNSLYYLGNMYLANSNFKQAEKTWKTLTESHNNSARGHLQLGNLYSCRQENNSLYDLGQASTHFQAAFRLNSEETGPLLQLAKIDLIRGDIETSERLLKDVTSSNFRSMEAYYLLGYLAWKRGNLKQAQQQFGQAVSIHSQSESAPSNIGEGETKSGNSPMISDSFRCGLLSEFITEQMLNKPADQFEVEAVYQPLNSELLTY